MIRPSRRTCGAALVVAALLSSCGSPAGRGSGASSVAPTAATTSPETSADATVGTAASSVATSTSTASASGALLEPGPIGDPQCAGGVAANQIDTVDGGRRQLDLTDTFVCVEGPRMSLAMPLPPSPASDTVTFLVDTRNEYGGAFVFSLPDGFVPPDRVRTTGGRIIPWAISPNGRVLAIYDPEALQGRVVARFELLAADGTVLADVSAAYPVSVPSGPRPTMAPDDADLAGAIATSLLKAPGPPYLGVIVTADEAACIGDGIVAALGATRVRELDIGLVTFPSLSIGAGSTIDEANRLVDVLQLCAGHWKRFAFLYATQGTGEMSEASAQCVERELTDDQARTFFVKERSGYRTIDHILPVEAAVDRCVTPAERERIDWN